MTGDAGATRRSGAADVEVARTAAEVDRLAARAAASPRVAIDVEANGLFAFRPALCTAQLAFLDGGALAIAVIDTLVADVAPLRALLGPGGPVKVLHDLTFDARLLAEAGAPLGRVRDTSVAARLLGLPATGLSALLATELGVAHDKRFQQHDWSRRPLTAEHLAYLAGDVEHLFALDDRFEERAQALDLAAEIADECAYKLASAENPPRDGRPGYVRIKGAAALDAPGRAVLRRLAALREEAAEAADVPPFKVVGNDALLAIARRRPASLRDLDPIPGAASGRAASLGRAFLAAVEAGLGDGDVPEADRALFQPERPDRAVIARRRARETAVSAFRRAEAKRRGVDEQAVLPGHCAQDLVDALLAHEPGSPELARAIAAIPGLGERRLARYGEAFAALAAAPAPAGRAPEPG
jgi:ribonuclease D